MGSNIPLVALEPTQQTPMPRTPLEAYARAVSLQHLQAQNDALTQQTQQQGEAFPVEQQQQQEILNAQRQENAARELQMKDSQILRQLGPNFIQRDEQGKVSGYDTDGYLNTALQNGVSPQTVQALAAQRADAVSKLAAADKSTREGEESRFKKLYQLAEGVKAIKDPQARQQAWINTLPEIARMRVDIKQFPTQAPSDQELEAFEATFGQHAQMLADAKTQAEIADKLRGTEFDQQYGAYKKNPGVDKSVPLEKRDQATFLSWKAKQSPTMAVMGNMLGAAGQGSALDQSAQRYLQTGELPSGFSRSPGTTAAIVKRAAELGGDQNIAANKATTKADSAALSKLQTQADQVGAFENTALKNLDLFLDKAKAIPDLKARFANVPLRMITGKMIGDKDYAAFNAARQTALTETAKVLSSANASGVLSDSARHEVDEILSGNLPFPAMEQVVLTLKQDMKNRHDSYQSDISAIKGRLNLSGGGGDQGGMVTMRAPNGATKQVPADQVEHYKAKGAVVVP